MANLVSVIRARLVHLERAVVQLNLVSADLKYTPLYRLLSNYEHREGELLSVREIVNNSQNDKENINGSITSCTIGQLIKQLWGDKVRLVKRDSRNQRQNYYLNLGKKTNNNSASTSIKSGWQLVYNQETKSSWSKTGCVLTIVRSPPPVGVILLARHAMRASDVSMAAPGRIIRRWRRFVEWDSALRNVRCEDGFESEIGEKKRLNLFYNSA